MNKLSIKPEKNNNAKLIMKERTKINVQDTGWKENYIDVTFLIGSNPTTILRP